MKMLHTVVIQEPVIFTVENATGGDLKKKMKKGEKKGVDRGIEDICTPLMEAASAGHVDIISQLIAHGEDVNTRSIHGNTPLMYGCAGGHENVVRVLLDAGANVEDQNEYGDTPLIEAAFAGHVPVAKILLEHGAGINTHNNYQESPLTLACYKGHLDMVRFLMEAGADQEQKTNDMQTPLLQASKEGHVEVSRLLLDSGAQVNRPTDSYDSPLTLAADGGHIDLARLLIDRGANIEEVNDGGYTPLMEAAGAGHEEMVALLLGQGANINAQTEQGQYTAFLLACYNGCLKVTDLLIKSGANIELGTVTPLMAAAEVGHLDLVRYLLELGADVHAQTDHTLDTALTHACDNGHIEVADLLLQFGADLEHESDEGWTPLMKACTFRNFDTVKFLISKQANVNHATPSNDHTPLSLACACGHVAVVELLLAHSADPFHKLKDNSSMLIEAAKNRHTNVIEFLLDYYHTRKNVPHNEGEIVQGVEQVKQGVPSTQTDVGGGQDPLYPPQPSVPNDSTQRAKHEQMMIESAIRHDQLMQELRISINDEMQRLTDEMVEIMKSNTLDAVPNAENEEPREEQDQGGLTRKLAERFLSTYEKLSQKLFEQEECEKAKREAEPLDPLIMEVFQRGYADFERQLGREPYKSQSSNSTCNAITTTNPNQVQVATQRQSSITPEAIATDVPIACINTIQSSTSTPLTLETQTPTPQFSVVHVKANTHSRYDTPINRAVEIGMEMLWKFVRTREAETEHQNKEWSTPKCIGINGHVQEDGKILLKMSCIFHRSIVDFHDQK